MLTIQLYENLDDLVSILAQNYNRQSTVYDDE